MSVGSGHAELVEKIVERPAANTQQTSRLRSVALASLKGITDGGLLRSGPSCLERCLIRAGGGRTGCPCERRESNQLERSVRSFERLGRVEIRARTDVPLTELLQRFVDAQRVALGPSIEITLKAGAHPTELRIDPDLLTAAFSNLAQNAQHAMPGGGQLTIETETTGGPLGRRVCVTFTDTGCGMDVRSLERIFDPGYSTKPGGRGRGLPYVRAIIRAHGGQISVESLPSQGTTVRIELPAPPCP